MAKRYKPSPFNQAFIREAYTPGRLFQSWIVGPIGSGKTTAMFYKLCYMAQLQAKDPVDGIRRTKAVVVRNTATQLNDTTLASWNYWFKPGIAGHWKATDKTFILKFGDVECEVLFRPLDTPDDISRVLSLEITFALIDEFVQIPRAIIEGLLGRCGRYPPNPALDDGDDEESDIGGSYATNWGMWGASNVGMEDSWWYQHLYPQRIDPDARLPANMYFLEQPPGTSPDAENKQHLGDGKNYYEDLIAHNLKAWSDQFVRCIWGFSLRGKPVLSSFNSELHVSRTRLKANPFLPLVIGLDPGMNGAWIITQCDLHDRVLFLGEVITSGMGAERALRERVLPYLRIYFPNFAQRDIIVSPDPAAINRAQSNETTVVDVVKKFFRVKFPDMNNRLNVRLSALEHYTLRRTEVGEAMLIDGTMCPALVRAFGGGWQYEEDSKGRLAPEPNKRNPHSHPADAASYACRYHQKQTSRLLTNNSRPIPKSGRSMNVYHAR